MTALEVLAIGGRWIWRALGGLAFIAGAIGLFLPVWPTFIFWVAAAACFARSNPAWRDWIYARPGVGADIESFVERGELRRGAKRAAYAGMGLAAAIVCLALWREWIWLSFALILIAGGALIVSLRPEPRRQ